MEGRTETEVNEPGYTPWYITRVKTSSITVSGVTFTLTVKAPTSTSTFRSSWSKALVQTPNYMRLVGDGVKVDNDSLLAHPGIGAGFELHIFGLQVGKHTLQTYHNIWEDTITINHSPFNVYLNGVLVHSRVRPSVKVLKTTDARILFTDIEVTQAGQEIVLRFELVTDFVPTTGKSKDLNICLNGFELNTDNASKQAREPMPRDADLHFNADTGFIYLQWKPAKNEYTKTHALYFGTDSTLVNNATTSDFSIYKGILALKDTSYKVNGLINRYTYYWRVDQTDSAGIVTKGPVWSFRPRHLAFRGAEGYGRFANGGRYGKVVEVTNLNDNGPGSFRAAVTNDIGPRTIIFNVSGIIYLNSRLTVSSKYVTIAGQTAPGKGICFRAAPLGLGPDGICRFVRMRLGAGATFDGIGMAGVDNGILDHGSISWTIDEAFSSRGAKNITLQRTLISEALNVAGHQNYPAGTAHGYAGSIGGDVGSFHHNLLAHCEGRNWSLAGGLDGNGYYSGRLDIFNMVVYNWGGRATDGGAHEVNFVNNYYKKGASTSQNTILKAQIEGTGKGSQSYYYNGNIEENINGTMACNGTDNTCSRSYVLSNGQVLDWTVFVDKPFFPSFATIQSAKAAYKSVLSDVGCNLPLFDDHDKRIITETLTGTSTFNGSVSGKAGLIDHQDDAGGYEDYPQETRPADFDTDHDGLPNWWEMLYGSNPDSPQGDFSDSNADSDNDGYTALEDYLEWMSVPHFYNSGNSKDTIDLSVYAASFAINAVYSLVNAKNITVEYKGSSVIITPNANLKGIHYFNFKVSESTGDTMIRTIGFCYGASGPDKANKISRTKNDQQFSVYPTIFISRLNIDSEISAQKSITAVLVDINGREIIRKNFDMQAGNNRLQLDCPLNIPSQSYFLKIKDKRTGKILAVKKVVKSCN
jgi:hypothetical protein